MEYTELIEQCRKLIECDTARISKPQGRMFLIIGFNKSTKDDKTSQFIKNGEPYDFDYVEEKVVATGYTEEELLESAEEYKRLSEITWEEYLRELK